MLLDGTGATGVCTGADSFLGGSGLEVELVGGAGLAGPLVGAGPVTFLGGSCF